MLPNLSMSLCCSSGSFLSVSTLELQPHLGWLVERVCIELCAKADDNDKQLTDRLLPVVRQRIDAATQALSDCLQLKDLTDHWYVSLCVVG